MHGTELGGEADRAGLVGGELDDDRLVRVARKGLACVCHAVARERRARYRISDVELAAVVRRFALREREIQIAQRLIALLLPAEPVLGDPIGDFAVLSIACYSWQISNECITSFC